EEKLEIQQKELLGVQEKCSSLMDKLPALPDEKKERGKELRAKLDNMSKTAEKLYEKMAESLAKLHTKELDIKTTECSMWTGLERTCRPLPQELILECLSNRYHVKLLGMGEDPRCPSNTTETETAKFMADAIGSGPGDDPFDEPPALVEQQESDQDSCKQLDMFKPSVRHLPRLRELLLKGLGNDDRVKLCLPRPLLSAGKALLSIRERVASILRLGPTVFKIGLTGDPMFRFYKVPSKTNSSAGYRYDTDQFAEMQVLYAGATWDEASLMEAVLIAEFQGRPGNRNINPGGEGRQVYDPPYFTYIVFKSALVAPKRQRMYAQGKERAGTVMH
ncbi:unnamed protein product, partial [Symbiodinium necroappetens]